MLHVLTLKFLTMEIYRCLQKAIYILTTIFIKITETRITEKWSVTVNTRRVPKKRASKDLISKQKFHTLYPCSQQHTVQCYPWCHISKNFWENWLNLFILPQNMKSINILPKSHPTEKLHRVTVFSMTFRISI